MIGGQGGPRTDAGAVVGGVAPASLAEVVFAQATLGFSFLTHRDRSRRSSIFVLVAMELSFFDDVENAVVLALPEEDFTSFHIAE